MIYQEGRTINECRAHMIEMWLKFCHPFSNVECQLLDGNLLPSMVILFNFNSGRAWASPEYKWSHEARSGVYLPRACMCVKQFVCLLSVVCCQHKNSQIWKSRHASEWLVITRNLSKPSKKLALLCFESFGKAHEHQKHCIYWPCLSTTPTAGHLLSGHAHNSTKYASKGHQQALACGCFIWVSSPNCAYRCKMQM